MPDTVVSVSQKLLISWDFQSLEFAENGAKNKKTSNAQLFCKAEMREVNEIGQWRRVRLVKADRKVTVTQITTHSNSGMQKSIF